MEMTTRLERRLQSIYSNAARAAAARHQAVLDRFNQFEVELSQGFWAHLSDMEIADARRNYFLRINRANGITQNIAADLARSGEVAAALIENEMVNIFGQGYRANVGNIIRQWQGVGGARINWAMYNPQQLRALLVGNVPGISRSPFTQIAYGNLWNQSAQNRMNTRLQNMFAEAILSGDATRRTLTRQIQTVTGFELRRARTIARTEGARVHNQGRYLAAEQAMEEYGIRTAKIWRHIPVAMIPRDDHMAMDGRQADEDGRFTLPNGERPLYPLDPSLSAEQSINCHCGHDYKVLRDGGGFYGETLDNAEELGYNSSMQTKVFENEVASDEYFGQSESYQRWMGELTDDEKRMIKAYTSDGFRDINRYLRADEEARSFMDGNFIEGQLVSRLDSAISKFELEDAINVHRRMDSNAIRHMTPNYDGVFENLVGRELTDPAFMSASTVAGSFGKMSNLRMDITVPRGAGRGAFIKNYSEYANENEFLLARGSRLLVTNAHKEQGIFYITAEVIPND